MADRSASYAGLPEEHQGLNDIQYGHKLLENIGLPPIRSNVILMGDCLKAVGKAHKIRPDQAYVWLYKRAKHAMDAGGTVNFLWFSNGEYNQVKMAAPVRSTYIPIDEKALKAEQQTEGYQTAKAALYAKFQKIAGKKAIQ